MLKWMGLDVFVQVEPRTHRPRKRKMVVVEPLPDGYLFAIGRIAVWVSRRYRQPTDNP